MVSGKKVVLSLLVGGSVALAVVAWSRPAQSHGDDRNRGFTNRDLKGTYGVLEQGTALGMNYVELSRIDFDGINHMHAELVGNLGGQTAIRRTSECTYAVRPNGMGTLDCVDSEGDPAKFEFVIMENGNSFHFLTLPDPEFQLFGTARRQ